MNYAYNEVLYSLGTLVVDMLHAGHCEKLGRTIQTVSQGTAFWVCALCAQFFALCLFFFSPPS